MLAPLFVKAPQNGRLTAIIPAQVRGARGMLEWTREHLSTVSGVPIRTLTRLETGLVQRPHAKTLRAIREALTAAGIEFIEGGGSGPGVRFTREAGLKAMLSATKGGT